MKKGTLFIILIFIAINGWAQRDYRKGYIITHEMDTIYGWVDYRGDVLNAKVCSFKKNETDKAVEYMPEDITAYRFVDSKYYVSKNVDNGDVTKQVFLEYLVNGMASVYYYRDNNLQDHYYLEKDESFIELKEEEKEIAYGHGTAYKIVKLYIGMLKATLNVYEMSAEIEKSKLDHTSLINIAKNYHNYVCTDGSECIVYEKKKPLVALRIAPAIGVDLSTLKIMNYHEERYKLDPSTNLAVGINLNFSMPRLNEKIFLQLQAMYTKYYFFDAYENSMKATDVHIRSNALQTVLAIKYEYPKGKWRPMLAVGGAAIWFSGASIEEVMYVYDGNAVRPSTNKYDFSTTFMFGFGVFPGIHYYLTQKRIIFLQAQYLRCHKQEMANFPDNVVQSFGLSAGIYF